MSFLFHLFVCRDFYKYLNANVKKKSFSFLLTHFLFWLVLWANPSAVILAVGSGGAPSAQPTCVISVTHEFLLMTSEPTKSWPPGLQKRSKARLVYLLFSIRGVWHPWSRGCSLGSLHLPLVLQDCDVLGEAPGHAELHVQSVPRTEVQHLCRGQAGPRVLPVIAKAWGFC